MIYSVFSHCLPKQSLFSNAVLIKCAADLLFLLLIFNMRTTFKVLTRVNSKTVDDQAPVSTMSSSAVRVCVCVLQVETEQHIPEQQCVERTV